MARRKKQLENISDTDTSIGLILTTVDKMKEGIKIIKSIDGFTITTDQGLKIKSLINNFSELLENLDNKEQFLSVYKNHVDLFNSLISTGNQLIQYSEFYALNNKSPMNLSHIETDVKKKVSRGTQVGSDGGDDGSDGGDDDDDDYDEFVYASSSDYHRTMLAQSQRSYCVEAWFCCNCMFQHIHCMQT